MKTWRRKCTDLIAEECLLDKVAEGAYQAISRILHIAPAVYQENQEKPAGFGR